MTTTSTPRTRPVAFARKNGFARDGLCLRIPTSAATLAGFRAWVKSDAFPEKLRVAFIKGEIYLDMSKEELETHAKVKAEICRVVMNRIRQSKMGNFFLDGVLVSNEEADVSNNPDGVFIASDSIKSKKVRLVPREGTEGQYMEIEGTPDWVMEIVSRSSVHKDKVQLLEAYHQAGIAEYWLIDARGNEIVFQILHWRKKGYVPAPSKRGWQKSRVFGRSFRLVRQRDDLGLWEYTLKMRAK